MRNNNNSDFRLFVVELISCQLIDIDATLNPEDLNEDQIFASRKERFIKFNHKDNELVVEVGISVPFINVPLMTGRDLFHQNHNPQIKINAPGLIIAGLLMFTSFVVVPTLFSNNPNSGFGFQRKDDDNVNRYAFLNNIEKALVKSGIDFPSCFRKSICWIMTKSPKNDKREGGGGEEEEESDVAKQWIDYVLK
ncbi:hypothetical protein Phum_PHUM452410 [Pediculus humanus corporis]|uniref:Uncharacterized protein n=1 Tax=Pediculus humanus subsp. corporis TaxID=121224 RepID=E0VUM4_PEDHC|nr:uncharacterized protein Phum_PHUM452410 [Pediculus humanus corporis]EEB17080.1 hypothetical protein Phum_PHUM452410 [Pediculus humanus corporis]